MWMQVARRSSEKRKHKSTKIYEGGGSNKTVRVDSS